MPCVANKPEDKLDVLLGKLSGVKEIEPGKFIAPCPAHNDQHPSLPITLVCDRILLYCRAGCSTRDVLASVGLDYPDLFLDSGKTKSTRRSMSARQPEPVPHWYRNWRRQCAELEQAIQAKRERHEGILQATHGLDVSSLTADEFDELMSYVGKAYGWLERCERLDEMLFDLQQTLRTEEQTKHLNARKVAV